MNLHLVFINPHSAYTVCEMEPEYEGGISGLSYVINETEFDYGLFYGVEYSIDQLTISKAVKKKNGKYGKSLSPAQGAVVTKAKKEKKNPPSGNLRGMFDRRRLSPTVGNRYVQQIMIMPDGSLFDVYML